MQVSNISNQSSFGSKVRINQSLSDLVMSYNYQRQVLLKNVQKLEKNGIFTINDITIITDAQHPLIAMTGSLREKNTTIKK